jgi:putative hemolysin
MKRAILVTAGFALAVIPLCASAGLIGDLAEGGPPAATAPDPAARLCIALGGISKQADEGGWGGAPLGLCRLHDDAVIADWTLFDALFGGGSQAADSFLDGQWTPGSGAIETWADEACVAAGGEIVEYVEHLRPSCALRMCSFPDGTLVETWTMFSGPSHYPQLGRTLQPPAISGQGMVFDHCPWPRTCMAPCIPDAPAGVLCEHPDGHVEATSFACCCCGTGTNSYAPLPGKRSRLRPIGVD